MKSYPFDPSIKHHLLISLGLALWIFIFLYATEPLDVNEFSDTDKLIYLPLYGLLGAVCYIICIPIHQLILRKKTQWTLLHELQFTAIFLVVAFVIARSFYLYVIVAGEPNPYSLWYYATSIYFPTVFTVFPIVILGRWAFGKYKNKRLEAQKIEIKGEGTYEGLRITWEDLIAIQSSDNYVEVSYLDQSQLKKQLIRNKLSVVEKDFPDLLRTHRSYLVNPTHFISWQQQKGKLSLLLSNDICVPVSKTYSLKVKSVFA